MTPGRIIAARLRETEIKQSELAFKADISRQYVQDLLNDRRRPSAKVARAINLALNLGPERMRECVDFWTARINDELNEWNRLLLDVISEPDDATAQYEAMQ